MLLVTFMVVHAAQDITPPAPPPSAAPAHLQQRLPEAQACSDAACMLPVKRNTTFGTTLAGSNLRNGCVQEGGHCCWVGGHAKGLQ